ncbi:MAG TPA: DPP IV N-terminal domain-containing protein [Steroidobacter sp.]
MAESRLADANPVYAKMRKGFPSLVKGGTVTPHWLPDGNDFWYSTEISGQRHYLKVDPETGAVTDLFDVARLRAALSKLAGSLSEAGVPFRTFEYVDDGKAIRFELDGRWFRMDLATYAAEAIEAPPASDEPPQSAKSLSLFGPRKVLSVDGSKIAQFENFNLLVRTEKDGALIELTTDGHEKHSWRLWPFSWSPGNDKLLAGKNDWRKVHFMPVIDWLDAAQETVSYALYPHSGGEMEHTDLFVFDLASGTRVEIEAHSEPEQQLWPLTWLPNGEELVFMRTDRLMKYLDLVVANARTGKTRVVLRERQETFVEGVTLNPQIVPQRFFHLLSDGSRFIWRSERTGWNNLYLYDLSGKLLRVLTKGERPVERVVEVDEKAGWIYYLAAGDPRRPYDLHLYRVDFEGRRESRLTDAIGMHSITFSPDKRFFVDSFSTVFNPPVIELRRADGSLVRELERADISELKALGWRTPEEFVVKAADGKTDLYGVLYKPHDFDPARKYPVVELEYMGNFVTVVPHTFLDPRYGNDAQALAQLGFIVFLVDGRGTPGRGKAFQDFTYGNIGRIEIPDHLAVLKQLAASRPYMDVSRVGIAGGSWGGYFAIRAMLLEPEVYKVGVAAVPVVDLTAARHPIEPYMGLPSQNPQGYAYASNLQFADRLRGKLLIIASTGDTNATFGAAMRMSRALIDAKKPFDLVVFPGEEHYFSPSAFEYYLEARDTYLVEHLKP